MKNKLKILLAVITTVFAFEAYAGDINWAGRYRVESLLLKNPRLTSASNDLSYLNHHLVLSPHVIAADGVTIYTRFDIFNNGDYPNSQFGQFFGGNNAGSANTAATGELDSETIAVTELYLSWVHQFGSLIAGRAPVHFGLGLTHNAGIGEFDHWFDRKDLIGYKFVMGNMYILPMYGKVREGGAGADDDIKDYMVQVAYENLDTDLEIGLFYQQRSAGTAGNDITTTDPIFNTPTTAATDLSVKTYNLFVKKKRGDFEFGVEGSMQSGSTGLVAAGGTIEIDASAVVAEIAYKPQGSKWSYDLKMGSISGDSSDSATTYEGYLVNRNYEVSMLMFNYVLGAGAGSIIGNENYIDAITGPNGRDVDVGQMSNVIYLAPGFHWNWSDKWSLNGRFLYAQLLEEQHAGQSTDLGYEFDLGVYHRPFDRFVIGVDFGYLVAGDAFKGPGTYENKNAYGVITKAAISF